MPLLFFIKYVLFFQTNYFIVVNIQGKAMLSTKHGNVQVVPGIKLSSDDKVHLENNTSIRVAGLGGTFLMRGSSDLNNQTKKASEFWIIVKSELLPTRTAGEMKARAGIISNELEAERYFQMYQDSSIAMLIFDTVNIEVSKDHFSDTSSNFFYFSYKSQGQEINKKIPWKAENRSLYLTLDKRLLLIDGKDVGNDKIKNASIYFFESKTKKSTLLSKLNLSFFPFKLLRPELCLVAKGLELPEEHKNINQHQITSLLNYIRAYYGQIDEQLLKLKYLPKLTCKEAY